MRNPNGFGAVIKLSGKRRKPYAVRLTAGWTDNGKQQYKYLGYYEKKPDAIIALAEYNKQPYDIDNNSITFAECYEKWSVQHFPNIKYQTVANHKTAYKYFEPIHNMPIKNIRAAHLQDIVNNASEKLKTVGHLKLLMNGVFAWAMTNDIITKDYSDLVRLQPREKSKLRKIFTDDEIQVLWDNINTYDYSDIPIILTYTGLRIRELLNITKDNVFLDDRYMKAGSKTKAGQGEDGTGRIIPLNDKIIPLIKARMELDGEYLIMSRRGKQMQYTFFSQDIWKKIMDGYKMEHTIHDCRATFMSLLDRTDANRTAVKRIVGHATKDITEHYIHKTIDELIEVVNKI